MFYYFIYNCPVGKLTVASDNENIIGLWIEGQKYFMAKVNGKLTEKPDHPVLLLAKIWLDDYFNGKKPLVDTLPLKPQGTSFQKEVWQILCQIPYGQTTTYGAIAKKIAQKQGKKSMSAQAVGGAVGHNPISIIIPCHRVLGAKGQLTGYAGGLDKKQWLLTYEQNK